MRLITEIWCATASCRSRAIRSRSSDTHRRASASLVRSARSALSVIASMYSRRDRAASPSADPTVTVKANCTSRGSVGLPCQASSPSPITRTTVTTVTRRPSRRATRFVTAKIATAIANGCAGTRAPRTAAAAYPASSSPRIDCGQRLRNGSAAAVSAARTTVTSSGQMTPSLGSRTSVSGTIRAISKTSTSQAGTRARGPIGITLLSSSLMIPVCLGRTAVESPRCGIRISPISLVRLRAPITRATFSRNRNTMAL